MIINHNMGSINAQRNMGINSNAASKSMEKLSSGLRINRAGDDAAGLSISEKMRAQIRGLDQASTNAEDGISMIQTAEGALSETHSILQRMRELAVQAGNGTNAESDTAAIQEEMNQLTSEINRIGNTTEFNTQKLLNGEKVNGVQTVTQGVGSEDGSINNTMTVTQTTTGVAGVTGAKGVYEFNGIISTGTINIDGKQLQITSASVNASGLKAAISGNTALKAKYDVNINSSGKVILTDKNKTGASAPTGDFAVKTTGVASVSAVAGAYELSGTLKAGKIKIEGETLDITGDTQSALLNSLKEQISGNSALGAKFTASISSGKITLTEVAEGSTTGVKVSAKNDASVAGVYKFQVGKDDVSIDGEEFENGTDFTNASSLVEAINTNDALKEKYEATVEKGQDGVEYVKLTQKEGQESATNPEINGAKDSSVKLQIGANENQSMAIEIGDMRAGALGLVGKGEGFTSKSSVTDGTNAEGIEKALDVSTHENAGNATTVINNAIETVSKQRSALGAYQNRLEHTINNLDTSSENLTAAESRIRDTDMASEMSEYSKNNILQQAAQAMLAQAKSAPQQVLQLLQ